MPRFTLQKPGLLLGEGRDEVEFFSALLGEIGIADAVQVLDYGGVSKLASFLSELSRLPGFDGVRTIAITRDADENVASAKTSLEQAIASSPLAKLVAGHFILPNNEDPGALEALWLASMEKSPFAPCVDDFFRCIESRGWSPSQVFAKNDKARTQLFIATRDIPNERFGLAAWHGRKETDKPWMAEKWIDFDHPVFTPLKKFIQDVFIPPQGDRNPYHD